MTFEQPQWERNFEQNTLVWLDEDLNDGEDINQIKSQLRQIINYVRIFRNPDECVDYMSTNEKEQIYFLVSGLSADVIVPLIYEMPQIMFIYIFSINTPYSGRLALTFDKMSGIFIDSITLCYTLRQDILAKKSSSAYNSSTLLLSALPSRASARSDRQEAAFMYFRLVAEVLVELKYKQSTKNEFISICRSQYDGNISEMKKIEEFSRIYSKEQAIRWYTRDSFLYRILNNALRTQDIDILFKLGFFIADLHNQLAILHSEQSKSKMLPSVVYRGQFMAKDEFENKILKNIGGFLSINSFFSTSANKEVASMFVGSSSSTDCDLESALFEITIESQKCRRPVADIKHMSYIEQENEILFSMTTVFRIESVQKFGSENIWTVRLLMNGEEDEELNAVANSIREELGENDNFNTLGGLLTKMGEYRIAENYYMMLAEDTESHDSLTKAKYYSNLSLVYSDQMNFDAAISYAEKALQLQQLSHYESGDIYTNLGYFNAANGNTTEAFKYLLKAENIYKVLLPFGHPKLGINYAHIGAAYITEKNFSKTLEYLLKATDIFEHSLPGNHPYIATAYLHIGYVYLIRGDYDSSVFYSLKCLEIQQRSLPTNHPHFALIYVNLGAAYLGQSNEAEAYNSFQKTLEIIELLPNHSTVSRIMCRVGDSYKDNYKLSEALNFYYKALDVQINSASPDYRLMMEIYKDLAGVYFKQKDGRKTIEYCEKAITIAVTYSQEDVACLYNMLACGYGVIEQYEAYFRYMELALDIARQTLLSNDSFLHYLEKEWVKLQIIRGQMDNNSETAKK